MSNDRRAIAGILLKYFPTMAEASSDEWHGFLNEQTGLNISRDQDNGSAFDAWRQALKELGLPVWGVSADKAAVIAERGNVLKAAEETRRANLSKTLEDLGKEAPQVKASDLVKAAAPRPRP